MRRLFSVLSTLVPLACCADTRPGGADATPPSPPEGALDPANPGVWIEGGSFFAGSEREEDEPPSSPYSRRDETSGRRSVAGFWLQQHEVTNEEYRRFDSSHAFPSGMERHPVTEIPWREAMAYAQSLGGTLPTEVQWEYSARGAEAREYPWGEDSPTCELAHYDQCEPRGTIEIMSRSGDVTPEGVHDLAGNVREWVKPIWFEDARHPVNADATRLKGGSWAHLAFFLRAASVTNYVGVGYSWNNIGFRVAWPEASRR